MIKAEQKTMEEIVSKEPTTKILVAHFGNGDEDDQTIVSEYCRRFGEVKRISIFPGISYGHLEFANV